MLTRLSRSSAITPVAAVLVWAQLLAVTPVAYAQKPAPAPAAPAAAPAKAVKPLAESLTGDAKSNYDVAITLYRDKDYTNASARFKQAYETSKDPRLLWNMAACQKALRHYSEVQKLVRQYVVDGGQQGLLSDSDKREAEQLLSVIDTLVAPLQIDISEAGADVAIDGNVVAQSPVKEPLQVDMGPHHVKVTKADFIDFDADVVITAGKTTTLKVMLGKHTHEGRVSIRTSEKQSTISVDGKPVGSFEWFGPVSVGTHLVRVTAPGFQPWQADFNLTEGGVRTFEVTLHADKKPIPLWVWIGGGVLLAGGLAAASVGAAFAARGDDCKPLGGATCPTGTFGPIKEFRIDAK